MDFYSGTYIIQQTTCKIAPLQICTPRISMTSCSSKALNRDFTHAYKSYTAQSEKWAVRGDVFMKADVRQWVKLMKTALVKLLHVYMLTLPGIRLIDAWFIPGYNISSYVRAELTVYNHVYIRTYSIDILYLLRKCLL